MIVATYHLACGRDEVDAAARWIAVEQTVEVPEDLIDPRIEAEVVGTVRSIDSLPDGRYAVEMAYETGLAAGQLPQLLSLVYGNISLKDFVRLERLELPADLLAAFKGPNHGVAGLRRRLGVEGRPLLATALKPRGKTAREFAAIAGAFARGGGDLIKDDHNLVDPTPAAFEDRVARCQAAVADAGGTCLYLPYLCAPVDRIDAYVEAVVRRGVEGVLVPPLVLGLDTVRALAERTGLLFLAHPTFSGTFLHDRTHGIEPGVLYGTLFRLAGVDVTVFVNSGGRFDFSRAECSRIAEALRAPLGELKPGWPCPAGGMSLDRIGDMTEQFGADTVLLVGGALLGHADDVTAGTRAYRDRLEATA